MLPPTIAAAEDLRQRHLRVAAAGQHVAVVAVVGGDLVVRSERGHQRQARPFLPDVQVEVGHELVLDEQADDGLLEAADGQHRFERLGLGHPAASSFPPSR